MWEVRAKADDRDKCLGLAGLRYSKQKKCVGQTFVLPLYISVLTNEKKTKNCNIRQHKCLTMKKLRATFNLVFISVYTLVFVKLGSVNCMLHN